MKKKTVALVLASTMLFGIATGGTIAWLTDNTEKVTNTFVVGDIDIDLDESEFKDGALVTSSRKTSNDNYKILPGNNQPKDPVVTVKEGSEACWLFVEVTEKYNYAKDSNGYIYPAKKVINWTANTTKNSSDEPGDGVWTLLSTLTSGNVPGDEVTYVYYIEQDALTDTNATDKQYYVLENFVNGSSYKTGEVSYNQNLTKTELDILDTLKDDEGNIVKPSLSFKAYAIQSDALKDGDGVSINEASKAWEQISK